MNDNATADHACQGHLHPNLTLVGRTLNSFQDKERRLNFIGSRMEASALPGNCKQVVRSGRSHINGKFRPYTPVDFMRRICVQQDA